MRILRSIALATVGASLFASGRARGQDYNPEPAPLGQLFSAQELDNLVAPVALYPDPILAQVFIAATFPDQVDVAARHVRVFGTDAIDNQPWDVSVKAVAHYPPVLNMLAERTDWAAALGQAYAYQSNDLMDAVQRLRHMAHYEGNLVSTPQQTVIIEREIIRIVPAQPRVIYVPVYDPAVIYYRPAVFHASIHTPYWSFGIAFPIGAWLNYDCDWYGRRVYYDGWRMGSFGWRTMARPYIQIVNVYVSPRYEVVNVNHTIINHRVNYVNLNTNNTVHKDVKFDGYARNITRIASADNGSRRGGVGGGGAGGRDDRGSGGRDGRGGGGRDGAGSSGSIGNNVGGSRAGGGMGVAQRGGNDEQGSGRASGRGVSVPQQGQSRSLPQQAAPTQPAQRSASPSGRAQPVQRPQQVPIIERQQQPQVIQRQTVPQQSSQTQQRQLPATQQRQLPATQQRQLPATQQRQLPGVQQRPAQQQQQQQAQRSLPPSARAQPRAAPAQSSAPPAASRGGSVSGRGPSPSQSQAVPKKKPSPTGHGG